MSIEIFDAQWTVLAEGRDAPRLYLLVDPAQDVRLPQAILTAIPGLQSKCLLTHQQGGDLERVAPHLVSMPPFNAGKAFWQAIFENGKSNPPSQTLIASRLGFDELYAHLHSYVEVIMPDDDIMILAFWDPAILGTLLGQHDDATLHIPGPALTLQQQPHFLSASVGWWYWGRDGDMHSIQISNASNDQSGTPLKLIDMQVDILVEASVPDHLLSYLRENKPQLLATIPIAQHYARIKVHLREARKLHLSGMRDILNYICAALIYGDQMHFDPQIIDLLMKLKRKEITLEETLAEFPI